MNMENKFIIEINNRIFQKEYEEKIKNLSKNVKLNGFRKGFVSENIIKNRFGENIKKEIENDILNKKISKEINERKIHIIDYPKIIERSEDSEKNIVYVIEINSIPKIDINLEKINIKKFETEITEEDVNNEINNLSKICNERIFSSSFSELGDVINIDIYEINNNGINYIFQNENFILDNKQIWIKFFKDNLINFTERDELESINKKIFLKINKIIKKTGKINKNFLKKIGIDTKKNLIEEIKKRLMNFSEILINKLNSDLIFRELVEFYNFDVPSILVERKKIELINKKLFVQEERIINEIKINLIFLAVRKKYNIVITKDEFNDYIKKNVKSNEVNLENEIYVKKIMKLLEEKANITKIKIDFKDLIKIGK